MSQVDLQADLLLSPIPAEENNGIPDIASLWLNPKNEPGVYIIHTKRAIHWGSVPPAAKDKSFIFLVRKLKRRTHRLHGKRNVRKKTKRYVASAKIKNFINTRIPQWRHRRNAIIQIQRAVHTYILRKLKRRTHRLHGKKKVRKKTQRYVASAKIKNFINTRIPQWRHRRDAIVQIQRAYILRKKSIECTSYS